MKESQTIEFKRCITENLKYEVIAFANTAGGTIYIGIDDDGTPVGIEDMDFCFMSVLVTVLSLMLCSQGTSSSSIMISTQYL